MSQTKAIPTNIKGHCPTYNGVRNSEVVGHHNAKYSDDENGIWVEKDYRILKCNGCDKVYFQIEEIFSEDFDFRKNPITGEDEGFYTPKIEYLSAPSKRTQPEWIYGLIAIDHGLYSFMTDIYTALNHDLGIMAAIGVRTVFDRTSELLDIDPAQTFAEKLDALIAAGKIGISERKILDILTDAGGAAAHRGWKPSVEQLSTLMSIIESFLYRTLILERQAHELKPSIPTRQSRKEKSEAQGKTTPE